MRVQSRFSCAREPARAARRGEVVAPSLRSARLRRLVDHGQALRALLGLEAFRGAHRLVPVRKLLERLQILRGQLVEQARRVLAIGHGMVRLAGAESFIAEIYPLRLSPRTDPSTVKWQNKPMAQEQPVPGYNVVHIIGQGGQAQVYLAEREHDGLRVALKVLDRALRNDRDIPRALRARIQAGREPRQRLRRAHLRPGLHRRLSVHRDGVPALGHARERASAKASPRAPRCASPRRSRRRSTRSTRAASCTATSSPPTSCSAPTAAR